MPSASSNVRVREQSGKHMLVLSSSQFDPVQTWRQSFGEPPLEYVLVLGVGRREQPRKASDTLSEPRVIMRRREVILMFAGAAASYPLMALAQQPLQMRRIGVVMLYPENDPQGQLRATAFQRQLERAGWTIGGNLQVNFQWGTGDADWVRSATDRALRQTPDVLLANGDAAALTAQQSTKAVPIIFIGSGDPVGDR